MADIPPAALTAEPFFVEMRKIGEEIFPGERFEIERVYVNCAVYGDVYFPHRDCAAHLNNVTVLYYGSLNWEPDWGVETIWYNDQGDAELAVSPRPNRAVVSRGGLLHKGGVASRVATRSAIPSPTKCGRFSGPVLKPEIGDRAERQDQRRRLQNQPGSCRPLAFSVRGDQIAEDEGGLCQDKKSENPEADALVCRLRPAAGDISENPDTGQQGQDRRHGCADAVDADGSWCLHALLQSAA